MCCVVGECNIQYALNPHTLEYYIIGVNARLSRSSALASKATGYPLACIAADIFAINSQTNFECGLRNPTDRRIFVLASALKSKIISAEQIGEMTCIDKWFLHKFANIIAHCELLECEYRLETKEQKNTKLNAKILRRVKKLGFSDKQIALHVNSTELEIRMIRIGYRIVPFVKKIDTVAAEWPCPTNYLYLTYNADEHNIKISSNLGKSLLKTNSFAFFKLLDVLTTVQYFEGLI